MNDDAIAARIDRLPLSRAHRRILFLISIPLLFDLADIFTFSYAAPALVRSWNLGMGDIAKGTAAGFLGMALGAAIGGTISDRIGRKRSLVLFVAFFSLFSLGNAFAFDLETLVAARFLTGMGVAAATSVAITYIAELFPAHVRARWQSWAMVIAFAAIPTTSLIARIAVPTGPEGWRWIFVWGAAGLPLTLMIAAKLDESPRWLARHGRADEADRVLSRLEARVAAEHGALPAPAPVALSPAARAPWRALFGPTYAKRTFALWAIWFFQTIGYYGFMSWVPTLLERRGIAVVQSLTYVSLMSLGAIPGALIAVFVSERFERKFAIAGLALLIAAFGLAYGLSAEPAFVVAFGLAVGMLMQSFATLCFAYTPEQYPTELRNGGTGIAYGLGRLANVINPFIVAWLFGRFGYSPVFAYIAGAWLITAVVAALFGARTTGRTLERIAATADARPHDQPAPPLAASGRAAP